MLSCRCNGYGDWYFELPRDPDFETFRRQRRVRCLSCDQLIDLGADCLRFWSYRRSRYEYEVERYGYEVPLADKYLCERCGEIYLNLSGLGYCMTFGVYTMEEYLKQYHDMTGFDPKKYEKIK